MLQGLGDQGCRFRLFQVEGLRFGHSCLGGLEI